MHRASGRRGQQAARLDSLAAAPRPPHHGVYCRGYAGHHVVADRRTCYRCRCRGRLWLRRERRAEPAPGWSPLRVHPDHRHVPFRDPHGRYCRVPDWRRGEPRSRRGRRDRRGRASRTTTTCATPTRRRLTFPLLRMRRDAHPQATAAAARTCLESSRILLRRSPILGRRPSLTSTAAPSRSTGSPSRTAKLPRSTSSTSRRPISRHPRPR